MNAPKRIQMSRQHLWRAENPDAVIVARPSKWGNPFTAFPDPERAVGPYRDWLTGHGTFTFEMTAENGMGLCRIPEWDEAERLRAALPEIAGRDLACWCPLSQPCHADVLLELANGVTS